MSLTPKQIEKILEYIVDGLPGILITIGIFIGLIIGAFIFY